MTFFFIFTLGSFILGIGLWNRSKKARTLALLAFVFYVFVGYFFLNKI